MNLQRLALHFLIFSLDVVGPKAIPKRTSDSFASLLWTAFVGTINFGMIIVVMLLIYLSVEFVMFLLHLVALDFSGDISTAVMLAFGWRMPCLCLSLF